MENITKGITGKLALGYALVVITAIIITGVTFFTLRNLSSIDRKISESTLPTYVSLKEFSSFNEIYFKLSSNWIYQPNPQDKEALHKLSNESWKELKNKIVLADTEGICTPLVNKFEDMIRYAAQIMSKLKDEGAYGDDKLIDESIAILDSKMKPVFTELSSDLKRVTAEQNATVENSINEKRKSYSTLTFLVIASILVYGTIGIVALRISTRNIVKPIRDLKEIILTLSRGELTKVQLTSTKDEIGEMIDSVKVMTNTLKTNSDFAFEIGKGNYESNFQPLGDKDQMGNALLNMRVNLKNHARETNIRNWQSTGLAKLGDLLRNTSIKTEELYDNTISFLVKYLGVNQAGLFIIEGEDKSSQYLNLAACFAYDRKKYVNRRVELDEGLVGQCYLEKEMIYLKEVPSDYIKITSGLGGSRPTCVLLTPIMTEEKVVGVLEIASLHEIGEDKIEFVKNACQTIASLILSVRTSSQMQRLLSESQQQTEELRAQEEEVKQNMEEMRSIQEEMERKSNELEIRSQAIDASGVACIEFTPKGYVLNANSSFLSLMGYSESEIIGKHHQIFVEPSYARTDEYQRFWFDLENGLTKTGEYKRVTKSGDPVFLKGSYTVIRNNQGVVLKVLKVAIDVTSLHNAITSKENQLISTLPESGGNAKSAKQTEAVKVVNELSKENVELTHKKMVFSQSNEAKTSEVTMSNRAKSDETSP